jgi:hypothetical protein
MRQREGKPCFSSWTASMELKLRGGKQSSEHGEVQVAEGGGDLWEESVISVGLSP